VLDGFTHPDFHPVARTLETQLAKSGGGAAVCAYYAGRCVVDLWGGVRDADGNPWERDTLCVSYSTTKGVVSTALHMLVDRGLIDYDDPVAKHWPEFAQAGKGRITVRDVMSHRAGLHNIRALVDDARQMLDWRHMVDALAAAPSEPVPERATAYQALTYGYLVGELVQRASGTPLCDFLRREIAEPLALDGLYIGAPDEALSRAAQLLGFAPGGGAAPVRQRRRRSAIYRGIERALRTAGHPVDFARAASALAPPGISSFDFSDPDVLRACIPAANGLFSARSLARLYAALAGGGELDGVRLLSPRTLARATEVQSDGFDQITVFRMRWRLGYHMVGTFRGAPRRAFGHFGYGGSGAWADPTRNLSFALVLNTGSGTPIGDMRILRLNTVLLQCARARHRRLRRTGATDRQAA
jgi:CubicO group peptidase (beta-lactamase class C family)